MSHEDLVDGSHQNVAASGMTNSQSSQGTLPVHFIALANPYRAPHRTETCINSILIIPTTHQAREVTKTSRAPRSSFVFKTLLQKLGA